MRWLNGTDYLSGTAPTPAGSFSYVGCFWPQSNGPRIGGTVFDNGVFSLVVNSDKSATVTLKHSGTDATATLPSAAVANSKPNFTVISWTEGSGFSWWLSNNATTYNGDMPAMTPASTTSPTGTRLTSTSAIVGSNVGLNNGFFGYVHHMAFLSSDVTTATERLNFAQKLLMPAAPATWFLLNIRRYNQNEEDIANLPAVFTTHQTRQMPSGNPVTRYLSVTGTGNGLTSNAPSSSMQAMLDASAPGDIIEIDGSSGTFTNDITISNYNREMRHNYGACVIIRPKVGTSVTITGSFDLLLPWVRFEGTTTDPNAPSGQFTMAHLDTNAETEYCEFSYLALPNNEVRITSSKHLTFDHMVLSYNRINMTSNAGDNDCMYIGCSSNYNYTYDVLFTDCRIGPIANDPSVAAAHTDGVQFGGCVRGVFRRCIIGPGYSQTLQFGNEGGPLDGILFDHCLILNTGERTDLAEVNITNVNASGGSGIHRNIAMRHCTVGPGGGPGLSGTLDNTTRGGSGFYSSNFSAQDCVMERCTVGSSLVSHNLFGLTGTITPKTVSYSYIGPNNLFTTLQFVGNTETRPTPNAKLVPGSPGAGWPSTSIGQPVYDGRGVPYAIVSNVDINGVIHDSTFSGVGAYAENSYTLPLTRTGLYRFNGMWFDGYDAWANDGQNPWKLYQFTKKQ